jgi:hypothetical protein
MTLDPVTLDQAAQVLARQINQGHTHAIELAQRLADAGQPVPLIRMEQS